MQRAPPRISPPAPGRQKTAGIERPRGTLEAVGPYLSERAWGTVRSSDSRSFRAGGIWCSSTNISTERKEPALAPATKQDGRLWWPNFCNNVPDASPYHQPAQQLRLHHVPCPRTRSGRNPPRRQDTLKCLDLNRLTTSGPVAAFPVDSLSPPALTFVCSRLPM
jgi:hypothetical protein